MIIFLPAVSQEVHVPTATLHYSSLLRASRLAFHLQTGISLPCFLPCQELFHYRHHSAADCSQLFTLLIWGYFATYGPLWSVLLIVLYNTWIESFLAGLEVFLVFFTSEPMGKLQTQSTMARIKSCFLSFFTKNLFFYGWPWMDSYFQNSGKLPSVYRIFTDFQ